MRLWIIYVFVYSRYRHCRSSLCSATHISLSSLFTPRQYATKAARGATIQEDVSASKKSRAFQSLSMLRDMSRGWLQQVTKVVITCSSVLWIEIS